MVLWCDTWFLIWDYSAPYRFGSRIAGQSGGKDTQQRWLRPRRSTTRKPRKWRRAQTMRTMMSTTNPWTPTQMMRKSPGCWKSTKAQTWICWVHAAITRTPCDPLSPETAPLPSLLNYPPETAPLPSLLTPQILHSFPTPALLIFQLLHLFLIFSLTYPPKTAPLSSSPSWSQDLAFRECVSSWYPIFQDLFSPACASASLLYPRTSPPDSTSSLLTPGTSL